MAKPEQGIKETLRKFAWVGDIFALPFFALIFCCAVFLFSNSEALTRSQNSNPLTVQIFAVGLMAGAALGFFLRLISIFFGFRALITGKPDPFEALGKQDGEEKGVNLLGLAVLIVICIGGFVIFLSMIGVALLEMKDGIDEGNDSKTLTWIAFFGVFAFYIFWFRRKNRLRRNNFDG